MVLKDLLDVIVTAATSSGIDGERPYVKAVTSNKDNLWFTFFASVLFVVLLMIPYSSNMAIFVKVVVFFILIFFLRTFF